MNNSIRQIQFVSPAPLVWAQAIGSFQDQSLSLDMTQTVSSEQIGSGLADGTWDVGVCVMDNVIAWNDQYDANLVMLVQLERSTELSFVSTGHIGTLAQAATEPIAVDATTNGFVLVLYRALTTIGIDWRSCRFAEAGGVRHRFESLMRGESHSTILIPPFDSLAEKEGYNVLWRGVDIAPHYPGQVVVARREWVASNRDLVRRYVSALLMANRWALSSDNENLAVSALVKAGYSMIEAQRRIEFAVSDLAVSTDGWNEVLALRRECGLMPLREPTFKTVTDQAARVEFAERESTGGR
ncbi:hypothetical protein CSC67_08220 [Pusillimonas caeni]|uniref:ABC transporter substrate-binding protein n=1 Tax=Pusillimonas caeni TaxID=1348472 RepID=UPI000E59EB43|nr:ABC transporter substrate-binding protein [Pusillimonas caeni]TFL14133.1 hypothetical protein CSC67_08220 [Pusillimonas caeni]